MANNFHVVQNPLIEHKLVYMRDKDRPPHEFSRLLKEVGMLMALEVARHLPIERRTVKTPRSPEPFSGTVISARKVVLVPILRAGLILAEGLRETMPFARIGYLGLHQNEDHSETVEYLVKLPEPILPEPDGPRTFILADPMIGTGNIANRAIEILHNDWEVPKDHIHFVGLLAGRRGMKKLTAEHPDVHFYVAGVDRDVDRATGRVVPGVGVIGERLFGI